MRLMLIGCEYVGTTTLAYAIHRWAQEAMGAHLGSVHDHWKIPHTIGHPPDLTDAEHQQVLGLTTKIKEAIQRHSLYYHTPYEGSGDSDSIIVGYYIEDTIYARLYYNYGGKGQAGDRSVHSKQIEQRVITFAPQTVLILVTAAPEVIARRMREQPHQHSLVREQDIDLVLQRFEEAYHQSRIPRKLMLDTSTATVEETLAQFVERIEPHLTDHDRQRMQAHRVS